jgi:hypothetical protein
MFLSAFVGDCGVNGLSGSGFGGRGRRFCLGMLGSLAQRHTGSQQKHSAQFEQMVVQWIFTHAKKFLQTNRSLYKTDEEGRGLRLAAGPTVAW